MGAKTKADTSLWVELRQRFWDWGINEPGQHAKLAAYLGTDQTRCHKWFCTSCEHYLEPSFTVGMKLLKYIETTPFIPIPRPGLMFAKSKHKCCICNQHVEYIELIKGKLNGKRAYVHATCLCAFGRFS